MGLNPDVFFQHPGRLKPQETENSNTPVVEHRSVGLVRTTRSIVAKERSTRSIAVPRSRRRQRRDTSVVSRMNPGRPRTQGAPISLGPRRFG